jgi:hypothetical protein
MAIKVRDLPGEGCAFTIDLPGAEPKPRASSLSSSGPPRSQSRSPRAGSRRAGREPG